MIQQYFKDAVNAQKSGKLVIISDWQGALYDLPPREYNLPLLQFLCDAQKAGHYVIITSTMDPDTLKNFIKSTIELARRGSIDLSALKDVRIITKTGLMALTQAGMVVDVTLDSQKIAKQAIPYATPIAEMTVGNDGTTSPFTISGLYDYCGVPRKAVGKSLEPVRRPLL